MPMYHLLDEGKAIQCLRCNLVSHHPQDVAHFYCGRCHLFLDQDAPYEHFVRLLSCVQAWLAWSLGDRSMPPMALQDLTLETLEVVMGQDKLARWLQQTPGGRERTERGEGEG